MPNHYLPWLAAWSDAVAITGLLLLLAYIGAGVEARGRISPLLLGVAVISIAAISIQFASGKILFAGDALMALLYVGIWMAALLAGSILSTSTKGADGMNALTAAWVFAAVLSVGIALVQWTGALSLGIYAADLPPGARPFANVAQPNNFCTLCFVGLCSLLYLNQRQAVTGFPFWAAAAFLLLGMVISQSRTGWLQIALLVACGSALRERTGLRVSRVQLLALGTLFAGGVFFWSSVANVLLLSTGRTLDDQMHAGVRLPYWRAMLDAIGREPIWGYGWQQVGMAQQKVALDHPLIGRYFEHSHNMVLDLLLWNGVPVGGVIVILLMCWLLKRIRGCFDARMAWLLVMVGGVVIHGMVEFPLDYAFILVPVGLAMGAIDSLSTSGEPLRVPRWSVRSLTLLLCVVFVAVAADYLKAEENYRALRLESARVGTDRIVTPAPQLRVLTQLQAFLQFARIEAFPGMRTDQLDRMREVAERFGYPPVLFRYALALALNEQPVEAIRQLQLLRHIWGEKVYEEAKAQIVTLEATKYPQLTKLNSP